LKILKLRDQIEGIVYCDYGEKNEELLCKPEPAFYHRVGLFVPAHYTGLMGLAGQAMHQAGVNDPTKCLFVDDNLGNVNAARGVGWIRSVHFREGVPETITPSHTDKETSIKDGTPIINNLQQLREVWADIFHQMD
jgi:pyrimidine and pyridine-specific 5'-nucleotidase